MAKKSPKSRAPVLYGLSLDKKPRASTLGVNALLWIVFWVLYIFVESPWWAFAFAILYSIHSIGVWITLIYEVFFAEWMIDRLSLPRVTLLYAITVSQHAFWYALVIAFNPDSFFGLPTGMSGISKRTVDLLMGFFISVETTSGLGSGAVFARSAAAFVAVGLNAVHAILFVVIAAPMIFGLFWFRKSAEKKV